jgi:MHS family proline/betaine transporter-like MFS transporter
MPPVERPIGSDDGISAKSQTRSPGATGRRRHILAGLAGNVMEWYDFSVYGYFAATLGRHFFPSEDPVASLLAAFGVFAAGFFMRPVGALLFGHIGDRFGRLQALTLSVVGMAVPTFLIGVLPDHLQIGVAASVFLVGCRVMQGLSVAGEFTTSIVFLVEGAAPDRRGFMGSWSPSSVAAGMLLGSAVGALISTLFSSAAVEAWGWRVPFLLGLVVSLSGLYVRRHQIETLPPRGAEPSPTSPVREAFRTQWRAMLRVAGLNVLYAVGFYLLFVYAVTYTQQIVHVRAAEALDLNTLSLR